ncbi:porin, partial [Hyphomicrobium sp.]|uniref:porin n=1 Tax=Hyphomicrobium sp. TaxID=82 RepID=UPI0025C0DE27
MTAAMLASGGARAADLGGNCCADLEERIAELEATTVRKGNRKVSITISGWVTQQIMGWDDSINSDAYVGTSLNDLGDRLHFDGSAKINAEWSAGYSLRFDVTGENGFIQDANNDDGGSGPPGNLNSYWWIKSERLGRISVGRQSQASDDTWVDLSGAGSIFAANLVIFDGQNFQLVPEGTSSRAKARWGDIATCYTVGVGIFADCAGDRTNSVRYDTPTWNGFVFSTSWGEDDFWDVALRHNGQFGAFKTAFGISYNDNSDNRVATFTDSTLLQVNFAFLHEPSGIFGSVHWGHENPDGFKDSEQLYLKAGVRANLVPLGATVFYGEYGRDEDMFGGLNGGAAISGVTGLCDGFAGTGGNIDAACGGNPATPGVATGSSFERFGFGVVQEIDAASMALWLKYKNYSADLDFTAGGVSGSEDFEDLHIYAFGGAIFF